MKIKLFLLVGVLVSALSAKDLKLNEVEEIERFYYNKGYTHAYDKAYAEGYKDAYRDFRKKLRKYKDGLRATEAGKYLYKEGRLRYPEVYRVKKKDGYMVKIVPPEIVGELTLEELGKLPEKYDDGIEDESTSIAGSDDDNKNTSTVLKHEGWMDEVVNSFREVGSDREDGANFSNNQKSNKTISVMFEGSEDLDAAIAKSDVRYTTKGNNVVIRFKSEEAYDSFCRENFEGVCR